MVTWYADGGVSGFDGPSGHMIEDKYLLASPGDVDVQGVTRLEYLFPAGVPTTYLNRIKATARLNFTAADVSANPGRKLTASMFVAPSWAFPTVSVPPPALLLASPYTRVWRGSYGTTVLGDHEIGINGPRPYSSVLSPNTKYWVVIVPTAVLDMTSTPSVANDKPIVTGASVNTIGRGLSMWTNRTPTAPEITSPVTGSVVAAGDTITLTYTSNDPDTYVGDDTYPYTDLAGVQVQYSRRPTSTDPSPDWLDLPIANTAATELGKGWYIKGSSSNVAGEGAEDFWLDRTMPVLCGDPTITAGYGSLSSGEWRLRLRTFDYGHARPVEVNPLANLAGTYTADTFPSTNTSPWSESVNITVTAQVPPPIPLSPINNNAIPEGVPITLLWQYRNTATPPFDQAHRLVEYRTVGDSSWIPLADEDSSSPSFTLPNTPVFDDPTPLQAWGFNTTGDVEGWFHTAMTGSLAQTNAEAHTGAGSLLYTPGDYAKVLVAPVTPGDFYGVTAWIKATIGDDIEVGLEWLDASLVSLGGASTLVDATGSWDTNSVFASEAPVDAAYAELKIGPAFGGTNPLYIDDVEFLIFDKVPLVVGHYEWRVQVTDTDAVVSDFSEVGQFWVVPAPGSGDTKVLPSETIDAATLGCGTHRVFVYRRGGIERVGEIKNITYLDWNRVRDDISTAKIAVAGWDIDCGNLLALLQTWAYELVIFRDNGYTVDRVWEGPITLLTYEYDKVTIQAKDVMGYTYRRIIKQKMSDSADGDSVTSRAARVLQNTFAPDDPNVLAYLQVLAQPDDAREYRTTAAYSRTAFEEVDDMAANAGLDYTAVGRAILLWGTKHRIGTLPEFRDVDLGSSPVVSEYGMSMANRYVVSDGNGVWGEATRLDVSGNDETYGLVEMLSSTWATDTPEDSGTYTQAGLATVIQSFEDYAERSIADRYPPPVVVRVPDNTTLNPGTVLSIQQLVPGVVIPLRSMGTLRQVVANQKLDRVNVVEEGSKETISITLSPFSRDDLDPGAEEA